MSAPTFAHPLARLYPFEFPERLAFAAFVRDTHSIDAITDQLAREYPRLVRPRSAADLFQSTAQCREGQAT